MSDNANGLSAEQAARWTALLEECRPVLANEGMEAVQALLAERGMSTIHAIAITRALLGQPETPLQVAIEAVAGSAARAAVMNGSPTRGTPTHEAGP
ncbi:hypothetical protein [Actinomadura macrotermitis]|uniref:Uncharacterized protein n=1 Tax=Actinomadura macrotermitis TaxID=2585200 RepID=A0A7K0C8S2_9ACTN|nr:hypothetical protein [Actinomadura macrotermitis]MQY09869.1 hypothetical protein [Actinomadura macrotermitis]